MVYGTITRILRRPTATCVLAAMSMSAAAPASGQQVWQPLGEPGCGGQTTSVRVSPHDPMRILLGGDMLGVGLSTDGGQTWQPTFGFTNWQIGDVTFHPTDPDIVWVGTMNGPYRSTDGGQNWQWLRDGMGPLQNFANSAPIEKVLFDPNNPSRLLAFGGSSRRWNSNQLAPQWGAVWEWDAMTETWSKLTTLTPTGSDSSPMAVGRLIVDAEFAAGSSTRLYATVDNAGVFRSDNGGADWAPINNGLPFLTVERLAAHPTNPDIVYVALSNSGTQPGSVYRTEDGGLNWIPSGVGLDQKVGTANMSGLSNNTSRFRTMEISPTNPNVLYTGDYRFGSNQGVAKSIDGGLTWNTVLVTGDVTVFTPAGIEMRILEVDPNNPDRVLTGGNSYVLKTEDGGATWVDTTAIEQPSGAFSDTGYNGWVSTAVAFNPEQPGHVIVQGFDAARILQSYDDGDTWTRDATTPTQFGGGRDVHFVGNGLIHATFGQPSTGFEGISRSNDNGLTWTTIEGSALGLPDYRSVAPPSGIRGDPNDPSCVWTAIDGTLYFSQDGGDQWTAMLVDSGAKWLEIAPDSTLYVSTPDEVLRSFDGMSFESIGGPGKPGRLALDRYGALYMAAHDSTGAPGFGVHRYERGVWTQVFDDQYAFDIAVDPNRPCTLVVITGDPPFRDLSRASGVYISPDRGETWASFNDNLPMLRGDCVEFDPHTPGRVVLGTAGRGFFQANLYQQFDVDGDGRADIEDLYAVTQNPVDVNGDGVADADDARAVEAFIRCGERLDMSTGGQ